MVPSNFLNFVALAEYVVELYQRVVDLDPEALVDADAFLHEQPYLGVLDAESHACTAMLRESWQHGTHDIKPMDAAVFARQSGLSAAHLTEFIIRVGLAAAICTAELRRTLLRQGVLMLGRGGRKRVIVLETPGQQESARALLRELIGTPGFQAEHVGFVALGSSLMAEHHLSFGAVLESDHPLFRFSRPSRPAT